MLNDESRVQGCSLYDGLTCDAFKNYFQHYLSTQRYVKGSMINYPFPLKKLIAENWAILLMLIQVFIKLLLDSLMKSFFLQVVNSFVIDPFRFNFFSIFSNSRVDLLRNYTAIVLTAFVAAGLFEVGQNSLLSRPAFQYLLKQEALGLWRFFFTAGFVKIYETS